MSPYQQLQSQMAVLHPGVVALLGLMLLVLGLALVAGGVHCWVRWRKLTR